MRDADIHNAVRAVVVTWHTVLGLGQSIMFQVCIPRDYLYPFAINVWCTTPCFLIHGFMIAHECIHPEVTSASMCKMGWHILDSCIVRLENSKVGIDGDDDRCILNTHIHWQALTVHCCVVGIIYLLLQWRTVPQEICLCLDSSLQKHLVACATIPANSCENYK